MSICYCLGKALEKGSFDVRFFATFSKKLRNHPEKTFEKGSKIASKRAFFTSFY